MRKQIGKVFIPIAMAVLSGCNPSFFSLSNAVGQIEKGMDMAGVAKLMGKPDLRRFIDDSEQWEYIRPNVNNTNNHTIVNFENGHVVSLDSFNSGQHAAQPIPPVQPAPPIMVAPLPESLHRPIPNEAYTALCNQVKKEPFTDDKFELIRVATIKRQFTCAQCAGLMEIFHFDDERMKVLSTLRPTLIDLENYKTIIDALIFLSNQNKAKKMLIGR